MKKLLCILMVIVLLSGCSPIEKDYSAYEINTTDSYVTGVWLSYTELDELLYGGNFKNRFNEVISNCKAYEITDMFVHIRAFCDSAYKSQYFPLRDSVKGYDFDILEYMIDLCHQNGIKFHAWINPYRVRTADGEAAKLSADSIVRHWLEDDDTENDLNVAFCDGIYLNPASSEAQKLVLDGIREIITNYKVDGIHFDDYFYPTQDAAFDELSYKNYCDGTQKPLSLDDWRRANVNALISSCYTAIKFNNKDIIFSISPSASINDNYNLRYADIASWMNSDCVDYIIPQLYFGFEYPDTDFCFENLLQQWQRQVSGTNTKLLIGLASYKINTDAEPDRAEWADGVGVISRQVSMCEQSGNVSGHIYFSYSSMCEYL